jgi:23S rRNA pseudouridine1911/1915/1917 synthase
MDSQGIMAQNSRKLIVPEDCAGLRVDRFLGDEYPLVSEDVIREIFAREGVLIDDEVCDPTRTLRKGSTVEIRGFEEALASVKVQTIAADVIYEDDDILILNKPTGCTVTRERNATGCPFRDGILEYLSQSPRADRIISDRYRPRAIHRIDRDTTGAIMFAISRRGELAMARQFQDRTIDKEYMAIVHGEVYDDEGKINIRISPHAKDVSRMRLDPRHGKPALTKYKVGERFRSFTRLRVWPHTGRRHQIRIHLAHIGHSIVADATYEGSAPLLSHIKRGYRPKHGRPEKPLTERTALHAHCLTFLPCGQDTPVRVEAPLPKDMGVLLKMLRKFGQGGTAPAPWS